MRRFRDFAAGVALLAIGAAAIIGSIELRRVGEQTRLSEQQVSRAVIVIGAMATDWEKASRKQTGETGKALANAIRLETHAMRTIDRLGIALETVNGVAVSLRDFIVRADGNVNGSQLPKLSALIDSLRSDAAAAKPAIANIGNASDSIARGARDFPAAMRHMRKLTASGAKAMRNIDGTSADFKAVADVWKKRLTKARSLAKSILKGIIGFFAQVAGNALKPF